MIIIINIILSKQRIRLDHNFPFSNFCTSFFSVFKIFNVYKFITLKKHLACDIFNAIKNISIEVDIKIIKNKILKNINKNK
jgi:hypothetical protein